MLEWDPSCNESTAPGQDYAIYRGSIGDYGNRVSLSCSTSRATAHLVSDAPGGYFLVVPTTSANEGSYGLDGNGAERAPASDPCLPQGIGACP
jgi:hypothetical protein